MQKLKQTIILSGEGSEVATLTLEKSGSGVFGSLKLFNVKNYDNLVLGISKGNEKVLKQNVVFNNGNTYNFKLNNLDNLEDIGCVLVQKDSSGYSPILWGKKNNSKDRILAEFNESYLANTSSYNNITKTLSSDSNVLDSNNDIEENENEDSTNLENDASLYETNEKEIDDLINDELQDILDDTKKDNLDSVENIIEEDDSLLDLENEDVTKISSNGSTNIFEEENKKLGNFEGSEFFELISEQIDDLFDNYPRVDELEEIIPNSKWVKIDFENNGNEYVLGLIYDNFDLKYICYGIPGDFNSTPPKQLGECQWLPLDAKNPKDGYFVIYQDAVTGDKVNVI